MTHLSPEMLPVYTTLLIILLIANMVWIIKTLPTSAMNAPLFETGDLVQMDTNDVYTVISTRHCCGLNAAAWVNFPVEVGLVGHRQFVTISNGKEYSGALLTHV